jgi:hypothetical protein
LGGKREQREKGKADKSIKKAHVFLLPDDWYASRFSETEEFPDQGAVILGSTAFKIVPAPYRPPPA